MAGQNYRDLIVWQKSMDLVTEIYRVTEGFPKVEMFGLRSQMRRSVVSIPSNIAEGQGRDSAKEFYASSVIRIWIADGNGNAASDRRQSGVLGNFRAG